MANDDGQIQVILSMLKYNIIELFNHTRLMKREEFIDYTNET